MTRGIVSFITANRAGVGMGLYKMLARVDLVSYSDLF